MTNVEIDALFEKIDKLRLKKKKTSKDNIELRALILNVQALVCKYMGRVNKLIWMLEGRGL